MKKPSQHQFLKSIASSFLLLSCVTSAQTIYDLTDASEEEPMIFTCSVLGEGCGIRGLGSLETSAPIGFCPSSSGEGGVALWAPTSNDATSEFKKCTTSRCTAVCESSCTCTLRDGSDCPTTDEQADPQAGLVGRVPILPEYQCKNPPGSVGPPLQEQLDESYSPDNCPNLMAQALPTTCGCTFNFCNGVFQSCDRPSAFSCTSFPGQAGLERCVLADRLCPSTAPTTTTEPDVPTTTPPTGGSSLRPSSAPTLQPTKEDGNSSSSPAVTSIGSTVLLLLLAVML